MNNKYKDHSENRIKDFEFILDKNNKFNLIEFGPGSGKTLLSIKKKFKKSHLIGFDLSPVKIGNGINNKKFIINEDKISSISKEIKSSDYLIFLDVLEHTKDPFLFISQLVPKIKRNSYVVISCPNFASIRILIAWLKGNMPKESMGYFDETHLHWISMSKLADIFTQNNFDVIKKDYIFSKKIIYSIFQKLFPSRFCSQWILIVRKNSF
jgi:2-polyprenyl-3-methyl-5-hydroxy-6-metoxy-1,4-benzoquinol methylase